jgi:O-antigen ligase
VISSIFLFLTILLAPLYVLRLKFGPLPTTLLEVLIIITIVSFTIEKFIKKDTPHQWKRRLFSPLSYSALALLLVSLFAVAISPNHFQALGLWRAYFLEPVLIYFVLLTKLREENFSKHFIIAWLGSALWISGLSIYQRLQAVLTPHLSNDPRFGRPLAVFNSSNDVALFVGPLAALSVVVFRFHKALLVVTIILFTAVWVSGSRGGAIALGSVEVFLLLAFIWCRLSIKWRRITIKVSAGVLIIAAIIASRYFFSLNTYQPPPKADYQKSYTDTEVVRVCVWQATRSMIIDHSIFGVGLDGFHLTYPKYHTCDNEDFQYPHNVVLNIWTELGIAGLAVFGWIYWAAVKTITKSSGSILIKTALLSALLYSLIHGLVDVPYFKNDLSLEFWVLLAALVAFKEGKLLNK